MHTIWCLSDETTTKKLGRRVESEIPRRGKSMEAKTNRLNKNPKMISKLRLKRQRLVEGRENPKATTKIESRDSGKRKFGNFKNGVNEEKEDWFIFGGEREREKKVTNTT